MPKIAHLGHSCCGCGACAAICLKRCINLIEDDFGFVRPCLDAISCTDCRVCDSVCPALIQETYDKIVEVRWAKSLEGNLLRRSSSGGIFGEIAVATISMGGAVYGAAFVNSCQSVKHIRISKMIDLDVIMRSKYVQSIMLPEIYQKILDDLNTGIPILFSGTACQVAGLYGYLRHKRADKSNLVAIDVICHGVPSPKLWRDWLSYLERHELSEITEINFRSKSTGWVTFSLEYKYSSEKVTTHRFSLDWYMKAFLSNASLRPSCFRCPSKRLCGSDLTLGDFWGIQNAHPEVDFESGISAVIVNTNKGLNTVNALEKKIEYGLSSFENVVTNNSALAAPVMPYKKYDKFMSDLSCGVPIKKLQKKWNFKPPILKRLRGLASRIKNALRRRFC